MKCPYCTHKTTEVVETREGDDDSVRRRRSCSKCNKRFTTYERVEQIPLIVIKKDGTRQSFDRDKLKAGIRKSVEKTTVSYKDIERIVAEIERELRGSDSIEIESKKIGQKAARHLKKIDKVAYIRFASVFKQFEEVKEFEKEVKRLK